MPASNRLLRFRFFKNRATFSVLCAGFFLIAASIPSSINLTPMIKLAKNLAVLHRNASDRISLLSQKTSNVVVSLEKGGSLNRREEEVLSDIIEAGPTLPTALLELNEEMSRLRLMLLEKNFFVLDEKFTAWDNVYDTAIGDAERFSNAASWLQKAIGGERGEIVRSTQNALLQLNLLNRDLPKMHERFQVIANLLEILQQAGVHGLPPSDRVVGETFTMHCKRTGHCGMSTPRHPGRLFDSHSIFAIHDNNPEHNVWACEATIQDYIKGDVKGIDHPYLNSARISYCIRCHTYRNGMCNNRWCNLEYSDEFERDAKIIEETATTAKP